MVTPAARREAVEHLRSAFLVSERRACSSLRRIEPRFAIAASDLLTKLYERVCASRLRTAAALAIGASMFF